MKTFLCHDTFCLVYVRLLLLVKYIEVHNIKIYLYLWSLDKNKFIHRQIMHSFLYVWTLNTINFRYGWVNKSILSAFMNWRRRSSLWIRKKKTSFCTYVGLANCFEAKIKSKKYARRSIIIERRCFSCVCTVHLICRNYDCMHIESRHLLHAMLCI